MKDFSGTIMPKILKFGTNVGYDSLYCVKENQHAASLISIPLFVHFSFSPSKFSVTDFTTALRARDFKFCMYIESGEVYCGTENKLLRFILPFSFFPSLTPCNTV